jgi:hypothetical protein
MSETWTEILMVAACVGFIQLLILITVLIAALARKLGL